MELDETINKLQHLVDEDPLLAINEARQLTGDLNVNLLKAAIFVDAGKLIKDKKSIEEGVDIFTHAVEKFPQTPDLIYNLANGLHALAISTTYRDLSWYKKTEHYRLDARKRFYKAATHPNAANDLSSQAYTNLGNLLWSSYRWVEAYDFYVTALSKAPNNGVASSGALKMLRYALQQEIGEPDLLIQEIEYLAHHVSENHETINAYAGVQGLEGITSELKDIPIKTREQSLKKGNEYSEFVISNNLTLSPTIHSHLHKSKYWDTIHISGVVADMESGSNVPEIFAMINIIKSDYILARNLLYNAKNRLFKETGSYADSLDYACYGINESCLTLAQRSALDILDKIAVASLSYLKIGMAKKADFKKAWFKNRKNNKSELSFLPKIQNEINSGNTALFALTEISRDVSWQSGFLYSKQSSRNSSTHRFTILHDFFIPKHSDTGCLEHHDHDEFFNESVHTLKLVRSAIIYLVQMVKIREKRLTSLETGVYVPLLVPSHEEIRGFDS